MDDSEKGMLSRAVNVGTALASAHIALARHEARRDFNRLVFASLLVGVGLLCLGTAWVAAQAALLFLLAAQGLSWAQAVVVVAFGNLFAGLAALALGSMLLRRPILSESRSQIKRTVTAMCE